MANKNVRSHLSETTKTQGQRWLEMFERKNAPWLDGLNCQKITGNADEVFCEVSKRFVDVSDKGYEYNELCLCVNEDFLQKCYETFLDDDFLWDELEESMEHLNHMLHRGEVSHVGVFPNEYTFNKEETLLLKALVGMDVSYTSEREV